MTARFRKQPLALCPRLPLTGEPPPTPLDSLLLCDRHHRDIDLVEAHALQQVLGIRVHIQGAIVGVLGEVKGGDLRHVLILSFAFFFLQFEGDASHRAALDPLHEMGGVACDLIQEGGLVS